MLGAASALALAWPSAAFGAASALIDSGVTNQYIRGFGVSSAWCSPATIAPAAAALWADDNQDGHAGLSILRTRIDPTGSFGAEVGAMTQARAQNPNLLVWSTEWTPPAAYKNNNSVDGPGATNTFNNTAANSTAYANYLVNYIKTIKTSYGIDLYAVSPQNEPDWNTSYESCLWSAAQFDDFTKNYFYPAIQTAGLPTKIMIPESFSDNLAMAATTMNDATAAPMVSIIGNHLYGGGPHPLSAGGFSHLTNQESWETEMSDVSGATHDPGMASALQIAGWMHSCMVTASMNAYLHWWIYSFSGSNEGLFGADCSTATKKLYAMGNFSKFVRPGYYRMGGVINSNNPGVNISAYKDSSGAPGKFVIVVINTNAAPVTQGFSFSNFNATSATPWVTDAANNLVHQASVPISGGTFSFPLPAQSLVSFVGYCPPPSTPTSTATPSRTATRSPSPTASATGTRSPTPTASRTPTQTPSPSSSATATPSKTSTASATRSVTASATRSQSPTATLTVPSSPTATPSVTPVFSPSSTRSPSPLASPTASPSASPVFSSTGTPTETALLSPASSPTATPLFSSSPSPSPTRSGTASATPSSTPSLSQSASPSPSQSNSPSVTQTRSPSATASASPSASDTPRPSQSPSASGTLTTTGSATPTATPSRTPLSLATATATWTPVTAPPLATAAPTPGGRLIVQPNPVQGEFATLYPPYFWGSSDVTVQVYSVAYVRLEELSFPNISWQPLKLPLQERSGGRLGQGLYYVVFSTSKGRDIAKMFVLR